MKYGRSPLSRTHKGKKKKDPISEDCVKFQLSQC